MNNNLMLIQQTKTPTAAYCGAYKILIVYVLINSDIIFSNQILLLLYELIMSAEYPKIEYDHIYIENLTFKEFNQMVYHLNELIEYKGYEEIYLCFNQNLNYVYSDILLQFSGILDYYQSRKKINIKFDGYDNQSYIKNTFFQDPRLISENKSWMQGSPLRIVWRFEDSNDAHDYVNSIIDQISNVREVKKGFLKTLEWSLWEILDNVIQHSDAGYGLILSDIVSDKKVEIAVFDDGKGIYNTLKYSAHSPNNAKDAIYLSMQENVTRDIQIGQGNGLYGLFETVKQNKGRLSIASSNSIVIMEESGTPRDFKISTIDLNEHACTRVNYNLYFDNEADIGKALGYVPVDFRIEQFEDDTSDVLQYLVIEHGHGFGTRKAGEMMRNNVVNLITDTKKPIKLNFKGIRMISSSFADEFIGKLFNIYGPIGFANYFTLTNMDETVKQIVTQAVDKRITSTSK